jgi:hypothetical protein
MATSSSHPADAPPSYDIATGGSSQPKPLRRVSTDGPTSRTARNGIPPEHRRSMEDENRELPPGWVRQFDPGEQHQFFVDTKANPPRSIWTHPYDDPGFLATLSPEERKIHSRMHRSVTLEDITAESSDDEDHNPRLPPRPNAGGTSSSSGQPTGIHRFTRKMKDKLTDSTHEQRQRQRIQREEAERKAYQAHMQARQAMARAMETGQPQFLCKDQQGRDVYIEPPGAGGHGYGQQGAYGYNPYARGPYATNPNVRFVRPSGPYGRPYGFGYGGGIGAPVAAGLLGGALLGGVLF